jgi:hypothetical protein
MHFAKFKYFLNANNFLPVLCCMFVYLFIYLSINLFTYYGRYLIYQMIFYSLPHSRREIVFFQQMSLFLLLYNIS